MEVGWVRSGGALHGDDQVQPLNKLLSRSQEGSWSCVLCNGVFKNESSCVFRSQSRRRGRLGGLDLERDESELERTGWPCWRAGAVRWA